MNGLAIKRGDRPKHVALPAGGIAVGVCRMNTQLERAYWSAMFWLLATLTFLGVVVVARLYGP